MTTSREIRGVKGAPLKRVKRSRVAGCVIVIRYKRSRTRRNQTLRKGTRGVDAGRDLKKKGTVKKGKKETPNF